MRAFAMTVALALSACSSDDSGAGGGTPLECSFTDPATGLCWQEPPAPTARKWQDALSYCKAGGLRLPKVQELRTLIRGCGTSECMVTDPDCLSSMCRQGAECSACDEHAGPGPGGCYWDISLTGSCDWYWTSSGVDEGPFDAWFIYFQSGSVDNGAHSIEKEVRCVR